MTEAPFDREAWRRAEPKRDGSIQIWLNQEVPDQEGVNDDVHSYRHCDVKFYEFTPGEAGPGVVVYSEDMTRFYNWRIVDYYVILHDSPVFVKAHKLWIVSCEHDWTEPHHDQTAFTINPEDPRNPIEVGIGPQHMYCKQCYVTSTKLAEIMEEMVGDAS